MSVNLSDGEYHQINLELEIDGESTHVFGLRVKKEGVDTLTYFKRYDSRRAAQEGLLEHADIQRAIANLQEPAYLPAGSFWEVDDTIVVTPYGVDQEERELYGVDQEERELYVLFVKEREAITPKSFYFTTEDERSAYATSLQLTDAKEAWNRQNLQRSQPFAEVHN